MTEMQSHARSRNSTRYRATVKFVRGDELLRTAQYVYKGSDDGMYLSIDGGIPVRLGGNEGFPESNLYHLEIRDAIRAWMKNHGT